MINRRLARSQQYFWLDSLLGQHPNNLPFTFVLGASCRTDLLREAACCIVAENPLLRSTIVVENDIPLWQTDEPSSAISFETTDCCADDDVDAAIDRFACQPFDLSHEHPCRFQLLRHGSTHYFTILLHHIVADARSVCILTRRLSALYDCLLGQQQPVLSESTILDYADVEDDIYRQHPAEQDRDYWNRYADSTAAPELTPSYPGQQSSAGVLTGSRIDLDPALRNAALDYCRQTRTSPFRLLAAAWAVTVMKAVDVRRLFVNYAVDVRPQAMEGVIGSFLNNLVLLVKADDPQTRFSDIVQRVAADRREAHPRQYLSLLDTAVSSILRNPHQSIAFNYPLPRQDTFLQLDGYRSPLYRQTAMHAASGLQLDVEEDLAFAIVFTTDDYPPFFASVLAQAFTTVLSQVVSNPAVSMADIVLVGQNPDPAAAVLPSPGHTVPPLQLLRDLVARHGDQPAVLFGSDRLTYRQLDEASDRVASLLLTQSTDSSPFVGVYCSRQLHTISMLIGVWKAGYAYIPLDPDYSAERLAQIIDDCHPALIITDLDRLPDGIQALNVSSSLLSSDGTADKPQAPAAPQPPRSPYAYMIYTSGTTGRPKGTPITHAGLANLVSARQAFIPSSLNRLELCFASIAFDASVWEIFPALLTGTAVCMASASERRDPDALIRLLSSQPVSCACLPPAMLTYLPCQPLPSLHFLVVAGEACPLSTIHQWQQTTTVINAYGPTENTVCATAHVYTPDAPLANNIGQPLANVSCYVLDDQLHLLPPGVKGQLFIGGEQLTEGYLNRPEQNRRHFVDNPFRTADERRMGTNDRLYATGDIVYRQPNCDIVFCGRKDSQVKLHGFRIELGEIEHQLERMPGVQVAKAVVEGDGADRHLTAYVQADETQTQAAALRSRLADVLPPYMLPSQIIVLRRIPLTINGKVDTQALSAQLRSSRPAPAVPPDTTLSPMGQQLAAIWHELLGDAVAITPQSHFFELGGNSLLTIVMAHRLQHDFGVSVDISQLYQHLVLSDLISYVERQAAPLQSSSPTDESEAVGGLLPIPPSLHSLLMHCMMSTEASSACHLVTIIDPGQQASPADVLSAWNRLTQQHDAFRLCFPLRHDGMPQLRVLPWQPLTSIPLFDAADDAQMASDVRCCLPQPYSLHDGPLYRLRLYRLPQGYRLAVFMHHLITDGWSVQLLHRRFAACLQPSADNPPQPVRTYADYARWYSRLDCTSRLAYWSRYLDGVQNLQLPMTLSSSFHATSRYTDLDARQCAAIIRWCADRRITPFVFFMSATAVTLSQYSRRGNFAIGYPHAGRSEAQFSQTMGYFVHPLPYRCPDLSAGSLTFGQLCRDVQQHTVESKSRLVSLGSIIQSMAAATATASRPSADAIPAVSPLFQVFFTLDEETPDTAFENHSIAQFPIVFHVLRRPDGYRCLLTCRDRVVGNDIAQGLMDAWQLAIDACSRGEMPSPESIVPMPSSAVAQAVPAATAVSPRASSAIPAASLGRTGELTDLIAQVLGIDPSDVTPDSDLFTQLGMNSVQVLELVRLASDRRFSFTVSDVYTLRTPDLIASVLATSPWHWLDSLHDGSPCAVLVCGYTPMHPFYDDYIRLLRHHYHLLVFDTFTTYARQHPEWDGHADGYVAYMQQVVSEQLLHEGLQPALVTGHSLGGELAIALADRLAATADCPSQLPRVLAIGANVAAHDSEVPALLPEALHTMQLTMPPLSYDGPLTAVLEQLPTAQAEPNGQPVEGMLQLTTRQIALNRTAWQHIFPQAVLHTFQASHFELLRSPWLQAIGDIVQKSLPVSQT